MGRVNEFRDKLLHSDNVMYQFLRSGVSSQTASWADLILSFVLFAWLDFAPWLSTACGAVVGGVINCIINYKFTFHANDCPWRAVLVKYVLVWVGSVLFNSLGTEGVYWLVCRWDWLATLGFKPDGYFAAARLFVALVVSWGWNFVMQRNFVYRPTRFDPYAISFTRLILPSVEKLKKDKRNS